MSDEARQRLLAATRRAAGEIREARDGAAATDGKAAPRPPAPGDLYTLAATADHAVEWLVATRHPAQPGRLLVVPADADPPLGSADLEVPPADGGPLVLRCRHGRWIDSAVLADGHRGGRLDDPWPAAAVERWRAVEAGDHRGSPLERETDDDPSYRDRDRELAAAGASLDALSRAAEHARERRRFVSPFTSVPTLRAVAAVLLVALLGVGWWALDLRRQVDELAPRDSLLELPPKPIELQGNTRGEASISFDDSEEVPSIRVYAEDSLAADSYVLEIVSASGRIEWSQPVELVPGREYLLFLRERLPVGDYVLRLVDPATTPPEKVSQVDLRVTARR